MAAPKLKWDCSCATIWDCSPDESGRLSVRPFGFQVHCQPASARRKLRLGDEIDRLGFILRSCQKWRRAEPYFLDVPADLFLSKTFGGAARKLLGKHLTQHPSGRYVICLTGLDDRDVVSPRELVGEAPNLQHGLGSDSIGVNQGAISCREWDYVVVQSPREFERHGLLSAMYRALQRELERDAGTTLIVQGLESGDHEGTAAWLRMGVHYFCGSPFSRVTKRPSKRSAAWRGLRSHLNRAFRAHASKPRVFVCYRRSDRSWVNRLQVHAMGETAFELWDDSLIRTGDWQQQIFEAIDQSSAAILFVDADFLASKVIREQELPRLLNARAERQLELHLVILNSCNWEQSELGPFHTVNPPDQPLVGMSEVDREDFFAKLVRVVRGGVERPD